jgi:general secretion pathway protein A
MSADAYQCFFTYFGLRENPFHVSPDPRFYCVTPAHDSAMNELLFGLQTRQGLLVLSGEAGTGKTTILNAILESLGQRHISTSYVFHSLLEPIELFEFILRDFGVAYTSTRKGDLVRALYDWLIARTAGGDLPVLIIDEAQSLSLQTLDELRLLLNLETPRGKLLQIILAGQSELEDKLRRPELRQLRQRIMFHCKLPVLSDEQTGSYIRSRLLAAGLANTDLFPCETIQVIHRHAKGIPRLINLLCEHALITAYGERQQSISTDIIQRIAIDFDLCSKPISVQSESAPGTFGRLISFPPVETVNLTSQAPIDPEPVQALIDAALLAAAAENQNRSVITPVTATLPVPAAPAFVPAPLPKQPSFETRFSTGPAQELELLRRAPSSFGEYWRSIGESFVSDCRQLRDSLIPAELSPEPALPEDSEDKSSFQRNLILPVAKWLRQPMTGSPVSVQPRPSSRSATQK